MNFKITVTYDVRATHRAEAIGKVARFNADLIYNKVQKISRDPEVKEVDCEVIPQMDHLKGCGFWVGEDCSCHAEK